MKEQIYLQNFKDLPLNYNFGVEKKENWNYHLFSNE
jgi:hypothetical protein